MAFGSRLMEYEERRAGPALGPGGAPSAPKRVPGMHKRIPRISKLSLKGPAKEQQIYTHVPRVWRERGRCHILRLLEFTFGFSDFGTLGL